MRDSILVVCTAKGITRTAKTGSALKKGERAVRVFVTIPDDAFREPATPVAEVRVPLGAVQAPALEVTVEGPGGETACDDATCSLGDFHACPCEPYQPDLGRVEVSGVSPMLVRSHSVDCHLGDAHFGPCRDIDGREL